LETTQNQIKVLNTQADKIIKETTAVIKPKAPVAIPLNTSYNQAPFNPVKAPFNPVKAPFNAAPTPAPFNAAPAPINPVKAPFNPTQAPINPVKAPFNPTQAPVPFNPVIPPAVENNSFEQPLPEETNLYNENKDVQINPQQNNFNPPKPVN
jgi:hypothetical protein